MVSGHDLAKRLRAAYLALHRRTNAALVESGVTADQFVLLTALAEGDGVTQKDLVGRTGSDPNTISEMLARLEKKGVVARERHAEDGRARIVTLTPCGRGVQAGLWERTVPLRAELESLFSPEGLGRLTRGLGRIATAFGPPATDPAGGPSPEALPTRPTARTEAPES